MSWAISSTIKRQRLLLYIAQCLWHECVVSCGYVLVWFALLHCSMYYYLKVAVDCLNINKSNISLSSSCRSAKAKEKEEAIYTVSNDGFGKWVYEQFLYHAAKKVGNILQTSSHRKTSQSVVSEPAHEEKEAEWAGKVTHEGGDPERRQRTRRGGQPFQLRRTACHTLNVSCK